MGDSIALYKEMEGLRRILRRIERKIDAMATTAQLDAAVATLQATADDESEEVQRFIVLRDEERTQLQEALAAVTAERDALREGQITDAQITAIENLTAQVEGLLADPRTPLPEPEPVPEPTP